MGPSQTPPRADPGPLPATPEPMPAQLGPYRLIRRLGAGGMGHIYLAEQPSVGRQVAIKVLPPETFDDAGAIARFQREIQILGKLSHPNICPVLEAGVDGRTHYYVMEYLRGLDLSRVIRTQRIEPRRAVEIAVEVGRALQFAHQNGIIHRDLKPLNVMLARGERRKEPLLARPDSSSFVRRLFARRPVAKADDTADAAPADPAVPSPGYLDRVMLIDFGLARHGQRKSALTMSGEMVGTPAYMSPEQARGDNANVGPATDVYALGATLYEMLTLRPPFGGDSLPDILMNVVAVDPAPPSRLNPQVDRDLETIVVKAMEKEPLRRYVSASAMIADLERWLAGEPIAARPASFVYRLRRKIARNRIASAAIAVTLATLLVVLYGVAGPGRIDVAGDLAGAEFWIDGAKRSGPSMTVWPPRRVRLRVAREGRDPFETEVAVRAGRTERVSVALVSSTGTLAVLSDPKGAEVRIDGRVAGITPLRLDVRTGTRAVEIRLAAHEPVTDAPFVRPGEETTVSRQLRHEHGELTLTGDPSGVAVELRPADGGVVTMTAAPATRLPLQTGRYRATARARNHFPREFELRVEKGAHVVRHVTLVPMEIWSYRTKLHGCQLHVGDANGDGIPDLAYLAVNPDRLGVLDGRDGTPLWAVALPHFSFGGHFQLQMADLDGDLEPEVLVGRENGERVAVYRAATGRFERHIETGQFSGLYVYGDISGDGVPDVVVSSRRGSMAAFDGPTGKRLWSVSINPGYCEVFSARLNADGVTDFYVVATVAYAIDGRSGRILWTSRMICGNDAVPVDLDDDGLDDLVHSDGGRRLVAESGRDGAMMWAEEGLGGDTRTGALSADLDGDGNPEYVRGAGPDAQPRIIVFDLKRRRLLNTFAIPTAWSLPTACDLIGDRHLEIVVPSSLQLIGLDPRNGQIVWTYDLSDGAESPLLGDFNGDGRQDLAVPHANGISVLAAKEPPIEWRQEGGAYWVRQAFPVGDPLRGILFPGVRGTAWLRADDGWVLGRETDVGCPGDPQVRDAEVLAPFTAGSNRLRLVTLPDFTPVWSHPEAGGAGVPIWLDVNGDGVQDVVSGTDHGEIPLVVVDGRSGAVLWKKPVYRRNSSAVMCGPVLCVATKDGVEGLRGDTGERAWRVRGGPVSWVRDVGGDLLIGLDYGRVYRMRPPDAMGSRETVAWNFQADGELHFDEPSLTTTGLFFTTTRGVVYAVDFRNGRELWRASMGPGPAYGTALRDLDGDNVPEVAGVTGSGVAFVLRGTDGSLLWSWRMPTLVGGIRPVWCDVHADGRPELLIPGNDNLLYAIRVRLESEPVITRVGGRDRIAGPVELGSRMERVRRQAAASRRESRWADVVSAARDDAPVLVWYQAAFAARRLGRQEEAVRLAGEARARGCRRIDLELLRCRAIAHDEAVRLVAEALTIVSLDHLLDASPDADQADVWRDAAAELERRGSWARAVLAYGPVGPWEKVEACFERAKTRTADLGPLLLTRARAALAAGRYADARRDLAEARVWSSAQILADRERAKLETDAEEAHEAGVQAWQAGRHAEALGKLELATRMSPEWHVYWIDLASLRSRAPGQPIEERRKAVEEAQRAVELLRSKQPDERTTLAWYLDKLAWAHYAADQLEEAVARQKEALTHPLQQDWLEGFRARLRRYEEALKKRRSE